MKKEEGRRKREEGRRKKEEGRGKREEGRKSRVVAINQVLTVEIVIYGSLVSSVNILFF
jgi:hypothetical protein